ncbi:DUF4097 family beta strand repeat-containing protein [Actinocatenispora rupis]|uniref:DUF4097 domain-containing protein n=1 Tax=Actinocatenispora rupis TaxID=519421 RepID=A0A8J3J4D4_9ACTN|nr:DUF4097 family beta strand repeat-containing protein [Actinocatenispora rupis]GID09208.1 hypothetical protein Aru02nite_00970 [Actinocatenispora rupis]
MYEFPCDTPVTAAVRISAGRCDLVAEPRDTVTVEVEPLNGSDERAVQAAADTTVTMSGDKLLVRTPETSGVGWLFGRRMAKLRITVHVPTDSAADFESASADMAATGQLSRLSINNASGDITVERVTGDVTMNTASGDIRVGYVGGTLKAKSASGDVTADRVDGDVQHHSASGDTMLGETHGAVRVHSASGDLSIGAAAAGTVRASTASGDVRVGVPAGTGVWLDLNTASGSTTSDLAVHAGHPLAGHNLELRISTASGDIEVHRVPALA